MTATTIVQDVGYQTSTEVSGIQNKDDDYESCRDHPKSTIYHVSVTLQIDSEISA